ncbi:E3 ubiquitin-protein ligase Siah2-like [Homalodisca vitripennis]|uniref:E3 ubiquitin-protein ligase Siah2-like n=1 Tax=Homalodisca vitripennis TaxID=197043 RepID=UPI001EEAF40D|nr:E3 ubiquitin-protein ligase Siah2-like [Homalodisca vitripennis]
MDNVPQDMVNRSFQKILDIARCAVCLETARPAIVQCEGEHILCGACSEHLNECPTCKRPFSRAKPARFMSQVLDALPKLCKHTNCGVYVSGDDEHEKWCGFQSDHVYCPYLSLDWSKARHSLTRPTRPPFQ